MVRSDSEDKGSSKTVEKVMQIINCFSYQCPELLASEIGRKLDLPTATLYRQLQSLVDAGFLQHDPETRRYSLDLHIIELAGIALSRFEVRRLGQVNLDHLCNTLMMHANLSVLYACDIFHLSYSTYGNTETAYTILGRRSPATQTAMGRILLSYLPWKEAEALVRRYGMRPCTERSITDMDTLKAELEKSRLQGYAEDLQSYNMNNCCLAAPVRSRMGEVIAAISVSTTPERYKEEYERIRNYVMDQALDVSCKLGYYNMNPYSRE